MHYPLPRLLLLSALPLGSLAQELTDSQIGQVKARLADAARLSWEIGTRAQVLLELDTPSFSVLSPESLPPSRDAPASLDTVLQIARSTVSSRPDNGQLVRDGSAADPASIGIAVLIANWTQAGGADFDAAARDQLNVLLTGTPKTDDGAISHRTGEVALWSDFVYMVPPFLAYYGVVTNNKTLVEEAHHQCKLYRHYLRDGKRGMWRHIAEGAGPDPGFWSTGNGWAAMGMLRVLSTIMNSDFSDSMGGQKKDLTHWIKEILNSMYPHLNANGLFRNYADRDNSFVDAASSALLAAATYRFALITENWRNLPLAERTRKELSTPGKHIDGEGWLYPVVNPHNFPQQGERSAEAQAFVLSMHAAWKDWVADGSQGANAAAGLYPSWWAFVFAGLATVIFSL